MNKKSEKVYLPLKKIWRRYGTAILAAVFLTVAGLYYGFGRADSDISAAIADAEKADWERINVSDDEKTDVPISAETSAVPTCYVHVCGEVQSPGVYELPEGSRIFQAVKAAGGFTEHAAEESLNLAGNVADGMQIVVMSLEDAESAAAAEKEANAGIVNLNTASKEQLMTLKGVGESRAEDIIRYREENGNFQKIEDIMKVPGIKEAGFLKIKDSITV